MTTQWPLVSAPSAAAAAGRPHLCRAGSSAPPGATRSTLPAALLPVSHELQITNEITSGCNCWHMTCKRGSSSLRYGEQTHASQNTKSSAQTYLLADGHGLWHLQPRERVHDRLRPVHGVHNEGDALYGDPGFARVCCCNNLFKQTSPRSCLPYFHCSRNARLWNDWWSEACELACTRSPLEEAFKLALRWVRGVGSSAAAWLAADMPACSATGISFSLPLRWPRCAATSVFKRLTAALASWWPVCSATMTFL